MVTSLGEEIYEFKTEEETRRKHATNFPKMSYEFTANKEIVESHDHLNIERREFLKCFGKVEADK